MSNRKVLIVEDEQPIVEILKFNLEKEGYEVDFALDGITGYNKAITEDCDLILLDVMLPKIDGFELITYINQYKIPVIFITAKADVKDRVKGLKLGAEDYIVKPFDVSELAARVEVVLRRYNKSSDILYINDLKIDTLSRNIWKGDTPVELTYKEFELLLLLVRNKNIALYRETIYEKIWQDPFLADSRTVDLHVQRLRKKLGLEKQIQTVFKV